ncbi:MAG: hypothetical protein GXO32_07555 [Crenarchaeota archaeon]|nr:hypothetical protein [Thermoproteota archaeon]
MLVERGSIATFARCSQVLEAFLGSGMDRVLKVLKLENGKLIATIPGEARDRVVELRASVERADSSGRIVATNDLGLQGVILEARCEESGPVARACYDLVLNPVALGISTRLAKLAFIHMKHGMLDRLVSFIRTRLEPYPELGEELLREDFAAKVMARARILDRFEAEPSKLSIGEVCSRYPRNSLFVVMTSAGAMLRMAVVGGLFTAHLKLGELEYRDARALEKLSSWFGKANVTVYSIDDVIPPRFRAPT